MPIFHVYTFEYDPAVPKNDKFEEDGSVDYTPGLKKLYAESEKQARKIFEEAFGYSPGELIERDRW